MTILYIGAYIEIKTKPGRHNLQSLWECANGHSHRSKTKFCSTCGQPLIEKVQVHTRHPYHINEIISPLTSQWTNKVSDITPDHLRGSGIIILINNQSDGCDFVPVDSVGAQFVVKLFGLSDVRKKQIDQIAMVDALIAARADIIDFLWTYRADHIESAQVKFGIINGGLG